MQNINNNKFIIRGFSLALVTLFSQSSFAGNETELSSCIGGHGGKRDLLLIKNADTVTTKSREDFLINNDIWEKIDETDTIIIYKLNGYITYSPGEYSILTITKDGKGAAYFSASYNLSGLKPPSFVEYSFECSGF